MRSLNPAPKCLALTLFSVISSLAWAGPTITVASPQNGATVGAPTYFDATASTTSCASGIAAMRIYSAPGVKAFTTDSFHLETFLSLKAGTYNTVIQAWDNCGGVSKVMRTITVTSTAGVSVFLPTNEGSSTTPVHFAASAQNPSCANGIAAIRIYPNPGQNAYTIHSATLDAFVDLLPGNYNSVVVQAWDNCGNVFKAYRAILDTGGPQGKGLYITDAELSNIAMYDIKNGVLSIPAGGSEPPQFGVPDHPNSIALDPPGNFAYVGLKGGGISVFEVNRANYKLFLKQTVSASGSGPADVTVDRAGAYLFVSEEGSNLVASYRINRSSGLLSFVGTAVAGTSPIAVTTEFSGRYVYASNYGSSNISAYALNPDNGVLTQVPGSPFPAHPQPVPIGATSDVLYDIYNGGFMDGYSIDASDGALTTVPGSPFDAPEGSNTPNSLQLDPFHNLLFYTGIGFTFGTDSIMSYLIEPNGSINPSGLSTGVYGPTSMALDPSYQYFYVSEVDGYTGQPQVISYKYDPSNGTGTILSGPLKRPMASPIEIAVSQ